MRSTCHGGLVHNKKLANRACITHTKNGLRIITFLAQTFSIVKSFCMLYVNMQFVFAIVPHLRDRFNKLRDVYVSATRKI